MKHKKHKKHDKKSEVLYTPKKLGFFEKMNVRLKHDDIMLFSKYLNVLLGSGLTLDESIDILADQSSGSLNKILKKLQNTIKKGGTLSGGLEIYSHIFSPVFINLIRAGESSGTLRENLDNLTVQMEKEHDLRQKVKGALMYPAVVFAAALIVTVGIVVFVMPNLVELFVALNIELPLSTKILLWVSDLFRERYFLVAAVFLVMVALVSFVRKVNFVKPVTHLFLLYIPVAGKISRDTNLARITRLMGTMLKSGMTLNEVLKITKEVVQNEQYKRLLRRLEKEVARGGTMSQHLVGKKKLFPILALRLIKVGEETGTLDKMLMYVAEFYEQEINNTTKNLSTLLEPFVIILIGSVVALLAASIITPIYKVIGSVK